MRIHLIAIGGSAMHNLALALQKRGHLVSGSDDEIYDPARSRLEAAGLLPATIGWNAERIHSDLDLLIVGMHARADNPELHRAREIGIPIHSYPSFLYEHARDQKRVVIGGSHGKTTTTSIIMHVLQNSNRSFDYLVGAQLSGFEHMVQLSDAPVIVLEGDEYLSSPLDSRSKFLHYRPQLAVLTGIAWDHINVFPTFDSYLDTFRAFIDSMEPGGTLFWYAGDPELERLVRAAPDSISCVPYEAFTPDANGRLTLSANISFTWSMFGAHNRANVQAAWLICRELGVSESEFADAVASFSGPSRRLEEIHRTASTVVYRDYAHAPSKVRASLRALRSEYPDQRLIVVFELHTYSSLNRDFIPHYAHCLDPADRAAVFFLPHTLEMKRMPSLEADFIRSAFARTDLSVIDSRDALRTWLLAAWEEGGVFALMSSGNFGRLELDWF